ncbi:kunitz trypsin inhibitor 4-like [Raphanus sativus]|uniref:Kunitz trypsin inhibitor 4-like n=1 Tax=Raphanus sativus TaxID=3726 RepID=A0A6J0NNG8_RAPSA|nr:kunitz trypsin inhibitor 4-like [Raphanus sativus]
MAINDLWNERFHRAVLAATANAGGPIYDTDGDVIIGGSYYVLPRIWGAAGGGLNLAPRGDNQCPLFIGQEPSEVNKGIPVRFSNWRSRVRFVPESMNLNIKMDVKATVCVQSTYWWVTAAESHFRTMFVTAGRKPEHGEDSANSFFQIKKIGDNLSGYKIAFCPEDKDCINVGIKVDRSGVRRLVLSSTPFEVVFEKATYTSSKTMSNV